MTQLIRSSDNAAFVADLRDSISVLTLLKTVLYANLSVQRWCLKSLGSALKVGEKILDEKELLFEEFFPRAQVSEEKLENLFHDVMYKVVTKAKSSAKNS